MIQLTSQNIQLHAHAKNKEDAIRQAGRVLVDAGNIAPGYVESMLGREQQANTYLGNGIAIPHGMGKDRELIHRTGVCVVQFPEGVEWNPGQMVRIVVGIAAKSDEHLGILAALTDVLDDTATADRLARTNDPAEIIAGLNRQKEGSEPAEEEIAGTKFVDARLGTSAGLHARPATAFVDLAGEYTSEIRVRYRDREANGKAMASLLKLGAEGGTVLRIIASGVDADAALAALKEAVEGGLGDEEEKPSRTESRAWVPESSGRAIAGVAASPGLAIGKLHHFQADHIVVKDTPGNPDAEWQKLRNAIESARTQLQDVYDSMKSRVGKNEAAIFRAHQAFLSDTELFGEATALIEGGHSAAWSWQQAIENRVKEVQSVSDQRVAGRAADLHDVGQRVLRLLAETQHSEPSLPDEPSILVADDLTPSDTAKLDPQRILGIVTVAGGPTSHTAIIARSLDIPAIVGVGAAVLELTAGITCILDGASGILYTEPSAAELESARQFQIDIQRQREEEHFERYQPALMTDGHRIEVVANIGKASEAAAAVEAGAEGIGLLRTEFLFLERDTPPTEDKQFEAYCEMTRALNGLPLIIRTLDIGGDKVVPYLPQPHEDNPFLGVRGIRLCLRKPELFRPQLRAIYRASVTGPVKIMFPMIATLEDLRAAKEIAEQVRTELGVPPVEIGIMVEVPSAAAMAAEFARECDFFSIGTNDLTQYVLAMDRMHAALAKQVDGLHPAVLRMIDQTVRGAQSAGKWVGVCGGIAGEPRGAVILAGLGVTELSMSIPSVAAVKAYLRGISHTQAQTFAKRALACQGADAVRELPLP
ncbi:phosphoenolpyruvate-protein phosphotransferase [Chthoniobacter flavus Ellin428]|uniref:phosphoenolpyruvate--protein phosphotransferase n=1 Tax=Chthoniobacter flavus Ellin428 TaxID=497964 RepID=B4D0F7_9BACT|nr:phosphoenolpyruvate--protein phosphotransferase [Chthoniobacter flavus]EDY19819.1 phosphoenolpyruvate-protein phosphotransferase [Chthoniobacter flavus Ellin428]TCO91906.1 phosphocarrier protein FPr [Chthoniobacter flavus]